MSDKPVTIGARDPNGGDITLFNDGARLGDRNFASGTASPAVPEAKCGNIIFRLGNSRHPDSGKEVLRINEEGFYVRGERVADGHEIYVAFKRWLAASAGVD